MIQFPGLISARLGLHCNDAYVGRGRPAMAALTSGGFLKLYVTRHGVVQLVGIVGHGVQHIRLFGMRGHADEPRARLLGSASTSRYSAFNHLLGAAERMQLQQVHVVHLQRGKISSMLRIITSFEPGFTLVATYTRSR